MISLLKQKPCIVREAEGEMDKGWAVSSACQSPTECAESAWMTCKGPPGKGPAGAKAWGGKAPGVWGEMQRVQFSWSFPCAQREGQAEAVCVACVCGTGLLPGHTLQSEWVRHGGSNGRQGAHLGKSRSVATGRQRLTCRDKQVMTNLLTAWQ